MEYRERSLDIFAAAWKSKCRKAVLKWKFAVESFAHKDVKNSEASQMNVS